MAAGVRCRRPVEGSATGNSRYEATQALEAILGAVIVDSFTLLPLEADKPWIATAGTIPDDEMTEAWNSAQQS